MLTGASAAVLAAQQPGAADATPVSERALYRGLIWLFVKGSIPAVLGTITLCFLGLQFSALQWLKLVPQIPPYVALFIGPELWLIHRYYKPLGAVWQRLDLGMAPSQEEISRALVRALNLPYYAFLRVTLVRGFLGAAVSLSSLLVTNWLWHGGFALWQIIMFPSL